MYKKEIKTLKREIKKKEFIKKTKELEIEDIEEREELIKEYESADIKCRSNLVKFLTAVGIPVIVTLVLLIARKISFFEAFNYIFLGEAITYFSWSDSLEKYQEGNKSFKKMSRKEYKIAKKRQQKEKAKKLTLSQECLQIDQEIIDLRNQIANIKYEAYQQKVGQYLNRLSTVFGLKNEQNKSQTCNLEDELSQTEIDTTQTLEKSYGSRKVG